MQNKYFEQPFYNFLLELGYQISGKSPDILVLWGRVLGFLISMLTLIIIYKITKLIFGEIAAKFSAFLYSVSPYGIILGVGIQRENLMWFFGLCAIFFLLRYLETEEQKNIILNLAFSFLAILIKFTGIYFLFASIVSLIFLYTRSSLKNRFSFRYRFLLLFLFLFGMILISCELRFIHLASNIGV